jgi:hypothetical protein
MSEPWRSGAIIGLEEIFRSKEFGRRPSARAVGAAAATVEMIDPPQLEEIFLSELFGHPEAIAPPGQLTPTSANTSADRPVLVLLSGGEDAGRDFTRYRGAIGAVSGVAAAALVVAGMTSGTGSQSGRPTISAQGTHPGHGSAPGSGSPLPGGPGDAELPNASGPTTGQAPVAGSAGGAPFAQLAAASAPVPVPAEVVVAVPPLAPIEVVPPPLPPGGGTSPSGTSPGGGGGALAPVFVTVGTTVSTVGAAVTATTNDLAHAVPAASPVTGLLTNVGATVTNLGQSVAGA